MNIKEIALFAWLPFLAADIGGILGGYLCPFFMKYFKMSVLNSRLAGVVVGALCMIGPGCIGLAANPYTAIALFSLGGFAHQMISALINCSAPTCSSTTKSRLKAGAIIPRNVVKHFSARAEERGFALFPPKRGSFSDEFFEDDGLSEGYRESRYGLWAVAMECDPATIAIAIKATGAEPPKDRQHDAALAAAGAAQGNGQERQDHLRSRYRGQPRGSC
jgi:hypothetical protein